MSNNSVTLMQLQDGSLLMVEPETKPGLDRRCFRQIGDTVYEYAHFADVQENGTRARFYGYSPAELPASMRCNNRVT